MFFVNGTDIKPGRRWRRWDRRTVDVVCEMIWSHDRDSKLDDTVREQLVQDPVFEVRLSVACNRWFPRQERLLALRGTRYPLVDSAGGYGGRDLFNPLYLYQLSDLGPFSSEELLWLAESRTPEVAQWAVTHPALTQNRTDLWSDMFAAAARAAFEQPDFLWDRWMCAFSSPRAVYPEMVAVFRIWWEHMSLSETEPDREKWGRLAGNENLGPASVPLMWNNPHLIGQATQRVRDRIQVGERMSRTLGVS